MRRSATLLFDVRPEVARAYLSDPVRRPEWQSSLSRVEIRDVGAPHVGQRWEDHTAVGLVAQMRTTELADDRWSESGTWRAVTAELTLTFGAYGAGCRIGVDFAVSLPGPFASVGWIATMGGLPAVRSDLARAGRILSHKEHP